jgi:purine-binding chemotaxis protein CheW
LEGGTPSNATVIGEKVSTRAGELCLVVRVGKQLYAFPVNHVEETMRPLPLSAVAGAPPFVRGMAVIRGLPVPVLDCAAVLADGDQPLSSETRFVALRIAARRVALSVREVIGVRQIDSKHLADLPPLLANAGEHVVTAIGTLDRELLMVLRSGKLVPEDVWAAIDDGEGR